MFLECPNCRESVSFLRAMRTPAWSSFPCKACGSVLGISLARRLLAAGVWLAVLIYATEVLGLYAWWGRFWQYTAMGVSLVTALYLFEKIVLLERRAFTCKRCGYDLHGLTEHRCPECGTDFDPQERERILARIHNPPPKPTRLWLVLLVVLLLVAGVTAGLVVYLRSAKPAGKPMPATTPTPLSQPTMVP